MRMQLRCAGTIAAVAVSLSLAVTAAAAEPAARPPQPEASPDLITHGDAVRMAQAALDDCAKRGQPTSVLVVDANGFQRVAFSDDRAKLIGVVHNTRKVATVLNFKASTQVLQARLAADKSFAEQYGKDERYMFQGGGLPVYRGGKLVAAISVGGSGDVNEQCAIAGIKSLAWASQEPGRD